jgi:hypothetical protein
LLLTSLRAIHSSQLKNLRFIFLIATWHTTHTHTHTLDYAQLPAIPA